MTMNEKLKNRILKYSALTSGVIALPSDSNAQIFYEDLNDFILTTPGNFFEIDLNSDLNNDFKLTIFNSVLSGTQSYGLYSGIPFINTVDGALVNGSNNGSFVTVASNPAALNYSNIINATDIFDANIDDLATRATLSYQGYGMVSNIYSGNWSDQQNKYLGLKFTDGANTHYGWLRLSVSKTADTIIVHDFAYNTTPNQSIEAGQTIINSIEENSTEANINYYQNSLYIKRENQSIEQLEIYSLDGKLIFEKQLNSTLDTISMAELPKGIYLVKVGNSVKKIII